VIQTTHEHPPADLSCHCVIECSLDDDDNRHTNGRHATVVSNQLFYFADLVDELGEDFDEKLFFLATYNQ